AAWTASAPSRAPCTSSGSRSGSRRWGRRSGLRGWRTWPPPAARPSSPAWQRTSSGSATSPPRRAWWTAGCPWRTAPAWVWRWAPVPEGRGLGIEVDEAAIEALRGTPEPPSRQISTVVYPSGIRWHFASEQQRHEAFYFGHLPGFVPGIRLEVREDDGSAAF